MAAAEKSSEKYRIIIFVSVIIISLIFGMMLGGATWIMQDTPSISEYGGGTQASKIFSEDGELLNSFFVENRVYVELEEIPRELEQAIIAIEDQNFYDHRGIDLMGIARALLSNIREGRIAEGGSTITQQLARSALLTHDRTIYRKLQEMYLALQFERLYTKSEILEMYLNEIFLGHNSYGVQSASNMYFGRDVSELNLQESAMLAGLPRSPNYYSPLNNREAATHRRNVVLNRMAELDFISENEARSAKQEELSVAESQQEEEIDEFARYFVKHVRKRLLNMFGAEMVYGGGLRVKTTLDSELQEQAESSLETALEDNLLPTVERETLASKKQPQYSLTTIDPETGQIKAMIGGRGDDSFNRSTQATRQPGSAFKPFVYGAAVEEGYSPGDTVYDIPRPSPKPDSTYQIWPVNFEHEYHGIVSLRHALAQSLNVAAVNLINELGVRNVTDFSERMGITTFVEQDYYDDHYSLALGGLTRGVTPLQMTSAYSVFANEGIWVEPYVIEEVRDREGNLIYESNPSRRAVLSEAENYLALEMLKSVIEEGTGWRADIEGEVAGKTGTTNDFTDAWFVGMTPDLATGIWIGEDSPRRMTYPQIGRLGSAHATMVWERYKSKINEEMDMEFSENSFSRPEEIVTREIDPVTGKLPSENPPVTTEEIFIEDNLPREESSFSGQVEEIRLDSNSGLLATTRCPEDRIETAHYLISDGTLLGPRTKTFGQNNAPEGYEPIRGTYQAQDRMPVIDIDSETGIPEDFVEDSPVFASVPTTACTDHGGFVLDEPELRTAGQQEGVQPEESQEVPADIGMEPSDQEGAAAETEEETADDERGWTIEELLEDLNNEDDVEEEALEDETVPQEELAEEEESEDDDEDRDERIDRILEMLQSDEENGESEQEEKADDESEE